MNTIMEKEFENQENELRDVKAVYEIPKMTQEQLEEMKKKMEKAKMENRNERNKKNKIVRFTTTAAAAVAAFVILPNTSVNVAHAMENIPVLGKLVEVVTFRDYQYESEKNNADIEIPELIPTQVTDTVAEDIEKSDAEADTLQENLNNAANEINEEIQEIADKFIQEFEENLNEQGGYQDMLVKSDIANTTQDYFTLKLICYQGAGSGAEWNYYYTIDLHTGERLELRDLFTAGADYITPISENIKTQMREQMEADEMKRYWLDDEEIPEWNFNKITDETEFYINENGNVVISFNEGDVAPMYMGVVTFEIPNEIINDILVK